MLTKPPIGGYDLYVDVPSNFTFQAVIVKSSRTFIWSCKVEAGQWMLAAAAGRMMEATDYIHAKLHQYTSLLDDTVSRQQRINYLL